MDKIELLAVTQADHDAAKAFWDQHMAAGPSESLAEAFARHRIDALKDQGVTVASLYGYEAGIEEGKRLASVAHAQPADTVEKAGRAIYALRPDGGVSWKLTGTSGDDKLDRTQVFTPDTWEESSEESRRQCLAFAEAALSVHHQAGEAAPLDKGVDAGMVEALWPKLRNYVTPPPFHHNEDGWRTIIRMLLSQVPYPTLVREGWQPIETAPRDGDEFLAYGPDPEMQQVVFYDPCKEYPDWIWAVVDGSTRHGKAFTHWRPLLAPPALTSKEPG